MNREIKFRGKRLDNGEWVAGYLLRYNCGLCVIAVPSENEHAWHKVDSDTIGQFTGLYDRVGKEIYEGDIVNWIVGLYGEGYVEEGRVEWAREEGAFVVINKFETKDNRKLVHPLVRCLNKIKVVGNVYDLLPDGGEEVEK